MVLKACIELYQQTSSIIGQQASSSAGLVRVESKVDVAIFLGAATGQLSFLQLIVRGLNVSAADARQQHNHSFN